MKKKIKKKLKIKKKIVYIFINQEQTLFTINT